MFPKTPIVNLASGGADEAEDGGVQGEGRPREAAQSKERRVRQTEQGAIHI